MGRLSKSGSRLIASLASGVSPYDTSSVAGLSDVESVTEIHTLGFLRVTTPLISSIDAIRDHESDISRVLSRFEE